MRHGAVHTAGASPPGVLPIRPRGGATLPARDGPLCGHATATAAATGSIWHNPSAGRRAPTRHTPTDLHRCCGARFTAPAMQAKPLRALVPGERLAAASGQWSTPVETIRQPEEYERLATAARRSRTQRGPTRQRGGLADATPPPRPHPQCRHASCRHASSTAARRVPRRSIKAGQLRSAMRAFEFMCPGALPAVTEKSLTQAKQIGLGRLRSLLFAVWDLDASSLTLCDAIIVHVKKLVAPRNTLPEGVRASHLQTLQDRSTQI